MINKTTTLLCFFLISWSIGSIIYQKTDLNLSKDTGTMQLYIYQTCPYCTKVISFLKNNNILDKVQLIDAGEEKYREELKNISGRTQAPFLVDKDNNVSMPESNDIIDYFKAKFEI